MPGQLFLDAGSVVVFKEAILLCVVLSYTIVNVVTELAWKWEMKANVQLCLAVRRLCLMTKRSDKFCVLNGRVWILLAANWARV